MKCLSRFIFVLLLLIQAVLADGDINLLNGGRESLKARIDLIESAREKIYMSYFIFEQDNTSLHFLDKLRIAAGRGVDVRILVDHMFNNIPKYTLTYLVNSGIKIKVFNRGNILRFSRRMHDKIFLVDSEYAILGGRNIEDTYYDQSPEGAKKNYFDRDILVKSELGKTIEAYFLDLWDEKYVKDAKIVKKIRSKRRIEKYSKAIERLFEAGQTDIFEDEELKELADAHYVDDEYISFVHDQPKLVKDSNAGTSKALYDLIRNAKHSVHIDSPYLILTKELEEVLEGALERGVYIRILTNSMKATDGILPQAAYLKDRKKFLEMGIDLYEFYGSYSFHAKSMVVDGHIAVVGSYNFDPRSQNLNTETAIIVDNSFVSDALLEAMDESLTESYKIDNEGNAVGLSKDEQRVSFGKRLTVGILKLLVPLFRGQL